MENIQENLQSLNFPEEIYLEIKNSKSLTIFIHTLDELYGLMETNPTPELYYEIISYKDSIILTRDKCKDKYPNTYKLLGRLYNRFVNVPKLYENWKKRNYIGI
jgi:hypothetical protein